MKKFELGSKNRISRDGVKYKIRGENKENLNYNILERKGRF